MILSQKSAFRCFFDNFVTPRTRTTTSTIVITCRAALRYRYKEKYCLTVKEQNCVKSRLYCTAKSHFNDVLEIRTLLYYKLPSSVQVAMAECDNNESFV